MESNETSVTWLERAATVAASCHALLWPCLTFYVSFEGHQGLVEAKDDKKYRFGIDLPGRSWTRNKSYYKWSAYMLGEISMIIGAIKTTIHKNNYRCLSCALLVLQLSSFSKSITYQHCYCSTSLPQPFCPGFTIKALLLLRCFIFFIISPSPGSHLKLFWIIDVIEIVAYRIPPASIACRYMDIFVNSWTAPKGPVCETAPALPFYFNSKCEVCKLGCILWCWARCCLQSWGRAEIGRLIWSILGELKMASQPHNRDLLRITTKMTFSWMWMLEPKCVEAY